MVADNAINAYINDVKMRKCWHDLTILSLSLKVLVDIAFKKHDNHKYYLGRDVSSIGIALVVNNAAKRALEI
ncbi:hypothetical protein A3Q56_04072 [Intoshia linei]|uniref:Uncharacterized protein n=1 Tax=Intoshia linei TaxID=1819745 RepID=A0A177B451_9BILA|nr:hypothetical protein A3Q56_04072 [Intoshia linei]